MGTTATSETLTELDRRANDRVEVKLLWSPEDNRVFVSVTDVSADDTFTIEVAAHEALDAFHHPFAYAAARGIEYRTGQEAVAA